MKNLLFVLTETNAEALRPLASQLEKLAKEPVELHYCSSIGELMERLNAQPSPNLLGSVTVISATASEKLNAFITECRGIIKICSFISLIEEKSQFPVACWAVDALFLQLPATDFVLSATLAAAMQQSRFRAKALSLGNKDEVDNLLNRPYFMHRLSEEISSARRHKAPLCGVILSVNYYRMYLDTYGYEFTNALLRFLGDEINRQVRFEDQVARVGDDELGLLLTRCGESDAKKIILRLTANLNSLTFSFGEYQEEVSMCAGVAAYPFPDDSPGNADTLIRYAHHALHQAKTNEEEKASCVSLFSEIRPSL